VRATELAPGGRFVAALPASPTPCPERTGLYVELIGDMNRVLADWCRAGHIGAGTVAAVVVPVWMRTLDEIRAPFEAGSVDGLELESAELFRLDNPYWDDEPTVFARGYVRSVTAWGGPLLLRAFAREGPNRAPGLVAAFLVARGARRRRARALSLGLHRGAPHLPQGGRHRARPDAPMKIGQRLADYGLEHDRTWPASSSPSKTRSARGCS
jgi:hypothetical protein